MKKLYGTICATITPLTSTGEIDEASIRRMCDHLADNHVDCLYPNGTTGESVFLSNCERQRIAEIYMDQNRGRMSLYIQCTAMTTQQTIDNILHAKRIGADGVAIMTPIFFPCDDEALYLFFKKTLDAADGMPAYLYNIPSHTSNDISPELFARLAKEYDNMLGIKYSAPNLLRVKQYVNAVEGKKDVLIGCDRMYLDCLMAGGAGAVSGICVLIPKPYNDLYKSFSNGDLPGALAAHRDIEGISNRTGAIPFIKGAKAMLKSKGIIKEDVCRAPLRPLTGAEWAVLQNELNHCV